ncbi:beta-N-acetylhexosaminidase [Demequina sp. B12]|uniref:beta-N-acetylhexosaminidase n=1 Tax=Demequina sp. B12 TaxID=2992757 RepID=UPI00237BA0BE|nr:beta-N-acetylhexosaminidase [Demequina sp. B12]MDE0572214.1 beta-N-acetylhexosaminidase [Demequina sp. B12]
MTESTVNVIPAPVQAMSHDGTWAPTHALTVSAPEPLAPAARTLARDLTGAFALDARLVVTNEQPSAADVTFDFDAAIRPGGYRLAVTTDGVTITVADLAGAHSAAQTLRQLAGPQAFRSNPIDGKPLEVGPCEIEDHPRFGWRGIHLDVSRHFVTKHEVLRFIDNAAAHHLNLFHFHLTDDQGWRMQIDRYPNLTQDGAWRHRSQLGNGWIEPTLDERPHGGFYTKDDLREIVAHARSRGITVMPEIDVPGHVQAAITAYPELSSTGERGEVRTTWGISADVLNPSEASLEFFRKVLDEVLEVFDSTFIGIGGDEVPTTAWRENPEIVQRAQDMGLAKVSDLHGWFLGQLADYLESNGRRAVVWDEGLTEFLPRNAAVTSWRGIEAGAIALKSGHDAIMAPEQVVYLDHRASDDPREPIPVGFVRTVEDVLGFDPLPPEVLAAHPELDSIAKADVVVPFPGDRAPSAEGEQGALLGAQAQVWTEHLDNPRRIDYATWPRLAAFAEVMWSPAMDRAPGTDASAEFMERLRRHLPTLEAAGIEFRPLDGPHPWQERGPIETIVRDLDREMEAAGWGGAGGYREDDDGNAAWPAT